MAADKAWIFKPTAASAPASSTQNDDPELLSLVSQYLESNGFSQTSRKLVQESEKRKIKIAPTKALSLSDIYQRFRTATVAATSPSAQLVREAADDTSDTLSAKSVDSSNMAKDSKPKNPRKRQRSASVSSESSSTSTSSSSSSSSASSSSSSSSSSAASSSSSSSSSGDSSSDDSSDSSSSSDSESGKSSNSSDSSISDDSSDDSSSDSSDSDSDSDSKKKPAKKPTKKSTPPRERKRLKLSLPTTDLPVKVASEKVAEAVEGEKETSVSSTPSETRFENVKQEKVKNKPFSRINMEHVSYEDDALKDNSFNGTTYAQRAHEDLIVTRGKGFTKEKNKKKRGAYRGGAIDFAPKSYKFKD